MPGWDAVSSYNPLNNHISPLPKLACQVATSPIGAFHHELCCGPGSSQRHRISEPNRTWIFWIFLSCPYILPKEESEALRCKVTVQQPRAWSWVSRSVFPRAVLTTLQLTTCIQDGSSQSMSGFSSALLNAALTIRELAGGELADWGVGVCRLWLLAELATWLQLNHKASRFWLPLLLIRICEVK